MKLKLVFEDWQKDGKSIYHTIKGVKLSLGVFHAGSTFDGNVELTQEQQDELMQSIEKGYQPIFWVTK